MSFRDSQIIRPVWPYTLNHNSAQARGLLLWVPCALPGGNKVFDFSGRNRHGDGTSNLWGYSQFGLNSIVFDAITDTVRFGNSSWVPTSAITISVWVRKTDTTNRSSSVCGIDNNTAGERCGGHVPFTDGKVYWQFGGVTEGVDQLSVSGLVFETRWHHWVMTTGPRGMELWQNGRMVGSNAATPTRSASTSDFRLGGGNHGSALADLCENADFRVYNRQLSHGEIYALYDPQTRFDLYWELGRRATVSPPIALQARVSSQSSIASALAATRALTAQVSGEAQSRAATSVTRGLTAATQGRGAILAAAAAVRNLTSAVTGSSVARSTINAVRTLAARVVGQARALFPFQPADAILTLDLDLETTLTLSITVADVATENIDIGDVVRVKGAFKNDVGAVVDPSSIVFTVTTPLGVAAQFTFPSADVEKISIGVYRLKYQPSIVGKHVVRCVGTGAAIAAEKSSFTVREQF